MQSKLGIFTLASMLLATFGSVAASPAASPEAINALAARVSIIFSYLRCHFGRRSRYFVHRQAPSTGKIHVCTDWDWKGSCTNVHFNNAQCTNFPSAYQDNVSSLGPDGGWECIIYG